MYKFFWISMAIISSYNIRLYLFGFEDQSSWHWLVVVLSCLICVHNGDTNMQKALSYIAADTIDIWEETKNPLPELISAPYNTYFSFNRFFKHSIALMCCLSICHLTQPYDWQQIADAYDSPLNPLNLMMKGAMVKGRHDRYNSTKKLVHPHHAFRLPWLHWSST